MENLILKFSRDVDVLGLPAFGLGPLLIEERLYLLFLLFSDLAPDFLKPRVHLLLVFLLGGGLLEVPGVLL